MCEVALSRCQNEGNIMHAMIPHDLKNLLKTVVIHHIFLLHNYMLYRTTLIIAYSVCYYLEFHNELNLTWKSRKPKRLMGLKAH